MLRRRPSLEELSFTNSTTTEVTLGCDDCPRKRTIAFPDSPGTVDVEEEETVEGPGPQLFLRLDLSETPVSVRTFYKVAIEAALGHDNLELATSSWSPKVKINQEACDRTGECEFAQPIDDVYDSLSQDPNVLQAQFNAENDQ